MKDLLSPKELAAAIGVSESSVRRWIDAGVLQTSRTVGGHRRVALAEAVRFVRASHSNVVRPELLGFEPLTTAPSVPPDLAAEGDRLYEALLAGDAPLARGLVLSLYLTGASLPALFDGPMATAMRRLGELYQHSPKGVLLEHRATDIALQVLAQLRQFIPVSNAASAPVAIGGSPSEDIYLLPSQMAAATLIEIGFKVHHFGPDVPLDTLAAGAEEFRPRIVYLSITGVPAAKRLAAASIYTLADRLAGCGSLLVVGGQQLATLRLARRDNLYPLKTMSQLAEFAGKMISPPAPV